MQEKSTAFGVGFRPVHYRWVCETQPKSVDFFEIVSENFLGIGGRPRHFLDSLRSHYPIHMHGVSLSIGSDRDPEFLERYLKQLKNLISEVQPRVVSDHLCFTTWQNKNSHDLLPVPYTKESLAKISSRVTFVQERLNQRLFLENPSAYVAFDHWDYSEGEFFAELMAKTGCGILLDVNNLYVNQRNIGLDPFLYLEKIRPEDVGYIHLSGHSDNGDVIIDTHDHPVCESVWNLYTIASAKFQNAPVLIEWDDNIPDFSRLVEETDTARQRHGSESLKFTNALAAALPPIEVSLSTKNQSTSQKAPSLQTQHLDLYNTLINPSGPSDENINLFSKNLPVNAIRGLQVYNEAYFLRIRDVLKDTFTALAFVTEDAGFSHLVAAYLQKEPPKDFDITATGKHLASYLKNPETAASIDFDFGVPLALLGDVAALEWAQCEAGMSPNPDPAWQPFGVVDFAALAPECWADLRVSLHPSLRIITCSYNVLPAIEAIEASAPPEIPDLQSCGFLVYRGEDFMLQTVELSASEATFIANLRAGMSFQDSLENSVSPLPYGTTSPLEIEKAVHRLLDLAKKNLVAKLPS